MKRLYVYLCECGNKFEERKEMDDRETCECPLCGDIAPLKITPVNFTFGFRLSDESLWLKGKKDEFVRDI